MHGYIPLPRTNHDLSPSSLRFMISSKRVIIHLWIRAFKRQRGGARGRSSERIPSAAPIYCDLCPWSEETGVYSLLGYSHSGRRVSPLSDSLFLDTPCHRVPSVRRRSTMQSRTSGVRVVQVFWTSLQFRIAFSLSALVSGWPRKAISGRRRRRL